MKKYFYKSVSLSIISLLLALVISCETTQLDLQDNPNELTESSADPNFILNGLQLTFALQHLNLSAISQGPMRHTNLFGTYASSSTSPTLNGAWASTYSIMNNLNLLESISEARDLPNHVGMGQVLEAFALVNLVDYIGTAVYSEAVSLDFPQPNLDSGESIYDAMYAQLNTAISNLQAENSIVPEDFYYNGDMSKWIKLANTLKLKMYVQTKLVGNSNALSDINAIIASGNYIKDLGDDFVAQANTQETNPDSRHPWFAAAYTISAGGGPYMSNDFLNTLRFGKPIEDPRLKYYIYRQTLNDPANDLLPCAGDPDFDYCYIGDGYWGRGHGDNEGIPNDNNLRSTYGVYPAGGAFDSAPSQSELITTATNEYNNLTPAEQANITLVDYIENRLGSINPPTAVSSNLGGAGIHPMILSSFSKFMLAEAALPAPAGLGISGSARDYLIGGLTDSFNKVQTFSGISMDPANVTAYMDAVLIEYDATTTDEEKLNIIIREYYIAMWGNSVEAYNNYRRTGYPALQEAVVSTTAFPRSYFIPDSEINSNDNPDLVQKQLTDQVFWDTNPAGFIN